MIIKRIKATNFKTYLDLDLDLSVQEDKPIILIGGQNGGGKTTLFEAICGALYGLKIKTRQQFNELLNNGALGKVEPKIMLEVTFEGQMLNQKQTYILRRTYMLQQSTQVPVESVYLNMNGTTFVYGPATAQKQRIESEQQVNKIIKANLPQELSQYFLFDAMQTNKLLEDGVFAQIIRDNFENVLGFNKYIQLKRASEKLLQEKSKERLNIQKEIEEYDKLCKEKESKERDRDGMVKEQETIYRLLASMKQAYDTAKAGAEDQEHIRTQIAQLDGQIKAINNAAVDYTESVRQFLESIEHDVFLTKMADALSLEVDAILRNKAEVQEYRENQLTPAEVKEVTEKVIDYLQTFSLVNGTVDVKQVVEHILFTCNADAVEDEYAYLDASEIDAIKQFANIKASNRFIQIDTNRKNVDADIAQLPDLIAQKEQLQKTITQNNQAIITEYENYQARIKQLKDDEKSLREEISKLETRIHGYDIQIQQEPDPKYDTLGKLKPFFEEVADTLLKRKKEQIEREMCEQLNELLLSYKGVIDRVELSDKLENFTIKMYHRAGNEISLNQLNAASKQIFIQVLLKVLRNLGDYNPPVMIDTVMGVLDNESRDVLMEEYFPKLAEQTILLCTTSEIRKDSDYKRLETFISKTYTLERNVNEQKTSVVEGYFGIALEED